MKINLLVLAFALLFCHLASASLDSTKFVKRWKITKHTKKGKAIESRADDFMQFNPSNSYEQAQLGVYERGKWKFNPSTNILSLYIGKDVIEWTISELTDRSLKATKGHEVLEMDVVSLKACQGDPYDDLTIICGKWRVADHYSHYSRVLYKPGDYIRFFPDGTVEEVSKGIYKKMTWKYERDSNKLTINNETWNVKELLQKKLKAERSNHESIGLIKL